MGVVELRAEAERPAGRAEGERTGEKRRDATRSRCAQGVCACVFVWGRSLVL